MLFIGAKSQDKNLGDITVNSINVADENGELKATLGASDGGGVLVLDNEKFGATVIGRGGFIISSSGGPKVVLNARGDIGEVITYNKKGNVVVYIGADEVSEDGAIQLSDRYGDAGWGKTGKR